MMAIAGFWKWSIKMWQRGRGEGGPSMAETSPPALIGFGYANHYSEKYLGGWGRDTESAA